MYGSAVSSVVYGFVRIIMSSLINSVEQKFSDCLWVFLNPFFSKIRGGGWPSGRDSLCRTQLVLSHMQDWFIGVITNTVIGCS
jgi:hypothetical protein